MNEIASPERPATAPVNKPGGAKAVQAANAASASCSNCLASIVTDLRNIVAERDRTRLGTLLAKTMQRVFGADHIALYRHVRHKTSPFLVPLAEFTPEALEMRDAYLISPRHGIPVDERPRLKHCIETGMPLYEANAGRHVCVLPVSRIDHPTLLVVEMERTAPFGEHDITLAQTIVGLFDSHLTLIDYAETDTLTGMLNRKTFDEHLDRLLANASDDDEDDAVLDHPKRRRTTADDARHWLAIIDIDHFKRVNDVHGHLIGDEVLLVLAQLMRDSVRMDDQLFRFGGEEFIILLQPTSRANAASVLERFRQRIEAHEFPIVGSVTISIGFTAVSAIDTPTDLIDRADKALYFAKENGRNRIDNFEELSATGAIEAAPTRKVSDIELF